MDSPDPGWGDADATSGDRSRADAQPSAATEGRAFGQYRIGELVATGPWTGVYRARDTVSGYHLSIKIATGLTGLAEQRAEFLDAAERARTLEPLTGLQIHDVGQVGSYAYVAYRSAVACSLADVVAHGPLDVDAALRLCESVATVLDAAHADAIVHGRLHAANVLFDSYDVFDARVFVADFAAPPADRTHAHPYSAPEWRRGRSFDGRADVFSLACLLFECITGTAPIGPRWLDGVFEPWRDGDLPLRLREVRPDASPALDALLAHAMDPDPQLRPATASALLREARAAAHLAVPPPAPIESDATPRTRRRVNPLVVAAAATVVVAIAAGALSARIFGGSPAAAPTTTTTAPPTASELAAAHLLATTPDGDTCRSTAPSKEEVSRGALAAVSCVPGAPGGVDEYTLVTFTSAADVENVMTARVAAATGSAGSPAPASAAPVCTFPKAPVSTTTVVPNDAPMTTTPAVSMPDYRSWIGDKYIAGATFCLPPAAAAGPAELEFTATLPLLWGSATRADGDVTALAAWWADSMRPYLEAAEPPPPTTAPPIATTPAQGK